MVPLLFFVFSVSAQVLTTSAAPNTKQKVFYNLEEVEKIFAEYIIEFNKDYKEGEYEQRLAIFKTNLEDINKLNKENNMTTFGINKFTDLTYEEMAKMYMGARINETRRSDDAIVYEATGQAPDELDYRKYGYVTDIKNQHTCGSCYVFGAIGNIEGQYAKKHNKLISLSEQQGFDCDFDGDCRGGVPHHVMQALAKQGGSMREEDYPYVGIKSQCRTDKSKIVVKVTGGHLLVVKDEEALKDALAEYGPLTIGLRTCHAFKAYQDGMFKTNCNGEGHAVLLIGYGTDESGMPYWLIKNSWGLVWGQLGYMHMQRGASLCNIGSYVATSTVA